MDEMIFATLALGLIAVLYISIRTAIVVRRIGFLRFVRTLGVFIFSVAAAGMKLVSGGAGKRSASRSEPLGLSGTGGRYNARTGNYDNGQDPCGIYPDDDRQL